MPGKQGQLLRTNQHHSQKQSCNVCCPILLASRFPRPEPAGEGIQVVRECLNMSRCSSQLRELFLPLAKTSLSNSIQVRGEKSAGVPTMGVHRGLVTPCL